MSEANRGEVLRFHIEHITVKPPNLKPRLYFALVCITLAAFAIRVYKLDAVPLRGDEAYSVMHWTAPPFTERWQRLIEEEPAPVGAFTMYWIWSGLTGRTEFAVRYLSVLGSITGLAVIAALTKRLTGKWSLAALTAILWAIHPYLIWHAQDARHYGVLSALTPLIFYWLLRALQSSHSGLRAWIPYIAVQTAAIYVYFFEPFWMVAQALFVMWLVFTERHMDLLPLNPLTRQPSVATLSLRLRGRGITSRSKQDIATDSSTLSGGGLPSPEFGGRAGVRGEVNQGETSPRPYTSIGLLLWWAFRAWLTIGILSLPVIAQLYHLMFVSSYEGNADEASIALLFTDFVPTLLFGDSTLPLLAGVVIALALLAGLLLMIRQAPVQGVFLLLWLFVPPLILYAVSFFSSFFRPRYVTMVVPALIMTLVIVPYVIAGRRRWQAVTAVIVVMGVISVIETRNYFTVDPPKSADWPSLIAYLNERTTPDDAIITDAVDPALEYYYDGPAEIIFIPKDNPDPAEYMPQVLDEHTAIYLLAGARSGDVGQYLQEHAQPIPGDQWPGVIQYRNWHVSASEIEQPLELQFGDVAVLRGYALLPGAAVLLYWEALSATESDYSVLLHVEASPDAPPIAVLDHAIADAVISTRTWSPGILYRDPTPFDLPPGEYTLLVGLYETATQEILPISGDTITDRRYAIGSISVSTPKRHYRRTR